MSKNRIEGAAAKGVGSAKEAMGKAIGDRGLQAEGAVEKAKGSAQNALGKVQDKLGDAVKK